MIRLSIEGAVATEIGQHINDLAKYFGVDFNQMTLPLTTTEKPVEKTVEKTEVKEEKKEEPKKETKKETKKTKNTKKEEEAAPKTFTKDDVVEAAKALTAAVNMDATREVFATFKDANGEPCARISSLREEDYEAFITACKAKAN